jgi:ribosomal protein L37AE/L43A
LKAELWWVCTKCGEKFASQAQADECCAESTPTEPVGLVNIMEEK